MEFAHQCNPFISQTFIQYFSSIMPRYKRFMLFLVGEAVMKGGLVGRTLRIANDRY